MIEHRCPTCTSQVRARVEPTLPSSPPSSRAGSLTFTCGCGNAATVATGPGPGRELARLGWTVRFLA